MSDRHQRVESLVRELAAKFILEEANSDPMITVTHVSTSPDYKRVTVFVTTIPSEKEADALIFLKRYAGALRIFIKKRTNLKNIPHIEFEIDHGERHRQH
ncbi:MAG: ribosome-binding factor A, partial [Candidatus Paceibacterota bacterium]